MAHLESPDERRGAGHGFPRRSLLLASGGLSMLALGIGGPARASVACHGCRRPLPTDGTGAFTDISRPIVPIGVTVIRGFEVNGATVSGVQLSAPPEYKAKQIPANHAFGLRFTAPHAGPFVVQATWSVKYVDDTGTTQSCSATAGSTLTAAQGTPLTVKPPPAVKFPPALHVHVKGTQYDNPLLWTWKCKADSDPTPLTVTVRWEVETKPLPLYSKGGNAPFTFSARAKAFTVTTGDSCDVRQAVESSGRFNSTRR